MVFFYCPTRRTFIKRVAFTLLELLVVLGLIVLIVGIGFPALHRMFVQSELKAGVRQLQGELYRTRLEAMKSGKPYVFRFEVGTPNFEIVPKAIFDQLQQEQTGLGALVVGSESSDGAVTDSVFSDPFTAESMPPSEAVVATSSGPMYKKTLNGSIVFGPSPSGISSGWSTPVLFYPNGRTSQTSFILLTTGFHRFQQELHLRGLTGTASITRP